MFSKAQRLLPWRMPNIISGSKSICKLPYKVKNDGVKKVLVITTAGSIKRGSLNEMFDELKKENISYVIYDDVQPDPTIECIEAVVKFYKKEACEGIIAVGGGSVMDCAKVTGARIVKPKKKCKSNGRSYENQKRASSTIHCSYNCRYRIRNNSSCSCNRQFNSPKICGKRFMSNSKIRSTRS